jgi:hypothetical protein
MDCRIKSGNDSEAKKRRQQSAERKREGGTPKDAVHQPPRFSAARA